MSDTQIPTIKKWTASLLSIIRIAERACGLKQHTHIQTYITRLRYSPVRVSISILSPIAQNKGTGNSWPVLILAGFMTLPEVSPRTAGSV
jgi:hypothetical protein